MNAENGKQGCRQKATKNVEQSALGVVVKKRQACFSDCAVS